MMCRAFITYVRPLMEYCTSIWSPNYKDIDLVEGVQHAFTRNVLSGAICKRPAITIN